MKHIEKAIKPLLNAEMHYYAFIGDLGKLMYGWRMNACIAVRKAGNTDHQVLLYNTYERGRGRLTYDYSESYRVANDAKYVKLLKCSVEKLEDGTKGVKLVFDIEVLPHCKEIEHFAAELRSFTVLPRAYSDLVAGIAQAATDLETMVFVALELKREDHKSATGRYLFGKPGYKLVTVYTKVKRSCYTDGDALRNEYTANGKDLFVRANAIDEKLRVRVVSFQRYGVDHWHLVLNVAE